MEEDGLWLFPTGYAIKLYKDGTYKITGDSEGG